MTNPVQQNLAATIMHMRRGLAILNELVEEERQCVAHSAECWEWRFEKAEEAYGLLGEARVRVAAEAVRAAHQGEVNGIV